MGKFENFKTFISNKKEALKIIGIISLFILGGLGFVIGNSVARDKVRGAFEALPSPSANPSPSPSSSPENQDSQFGKIIPDVEPSPKPKSPKTNSPSPTPTPSPNPSPSPSSSPSPSPSPSPTPIPSPAPLCSPCEKDKAVEDCGNPSQRACEEVNGGNFCVTAGDACIQTGDCGCGPSPSPSSP